MYRGAVRKVNWEKLETYRFNLHHPKRATTAMYRDSSIRRDKEFRGSCGTYALACVTGLTLHTVDKALGRGLDEWTEANAVRFLRKRGFKVHQVTIGNLIGSKNKATLEPPITEFHVVLVGQHIIETEDTWGVLYGNYYFHYGDVERPSPMEFLTNPIDCAYVVWHPSWKKFNKHRAERIEVSNVLNKYEERMFEYRALLTHYRGDKA